jgi:hypothetical protein
MTEIEAIEVLGLNGFPEVTADLLIHCARAGGSVAVLRNARTYEILHRGDGIFQVLIG